MYKVGISMAGVSGGPSSWSAEGHFLTVSPQGPFSVYDLIKLCSFRGPVSKYGHTGDQGFNMNLGGTFQSIICLGKKGVVF